MAGSAVLVALTSYLVNVTRNDGEMLNLTNLKLSLTSIIYYQDAETGEYKEYQRLDGSENRIWVDLEDIPQHVKDAYIAVEDKDFYDHHGVDIVGTVAAMVNEYTPIKLFSSRQGASTITQQLVKNLVDDRAVSGLDGALRKVREIFRAFTLEKNYSKDMIMEAYLNKISLSGMIAGVQAGAEIYFDKNASEVTPAEAAMIAKMSPFDAEEFLVVNMIRSNTFWWLIMGSLGIAFIGVIYGGIMLIFDFKRPAWKPGLVLFIAWLISFFVLMAWILAQVAEWLPTII